MTTSLASDIILIKARKQQIHEAEIIGTIKCRYYCVHWTHLDLITSPQQPWQSNSINSTWMYPSLPTALYQVVSYHTDLIGF